MNIILFGPPGAGKGTQAQQIVIRHNYFQLSTGDLLRNEVKKNSNLGKEIEKNISKGNFVSDTIVSNLIEEFVSKNEFMNRLIFDGFPRNILQAENLNAILKRYKQKIDLVLKLSVSLDIIKKRILGRSVCSICGKIYNEFFNPPPINSECCASKFLQKRSDDTLDVAVARYQTYEKKIEPVIDFYKKYDLLKIVNGEASISEINNEISALLESIEG